MRERRELHHHQTSRKKETRCKHIPVVRAACSGTVHPVPVTSFATCSCRIVTDTRKLAYCCAEATQEYCHEELGNSNSWPQQLSRSGVRTPNQAAVTAPGRPFYGALLLYKRSKRLARHSITAVRKRCAGLLEELNFARHSGHQCLQS